MTRPLVFLDFETDGPGEPDPATDRIVQAGFLRMEPSGEAGSRTRLIHPGPEFMPLKRSEIHGVADSMLVDAVTFASIARSFHDSVIAGADIGTFNGGNYDVPLLWEEFFRCGIQWDVTQHNFIDVAVLWRKMEPRSLSDAVRRFTGKDPGEDMHDAGVDATWTAEVMRGMLEKWPETPRTVEDLAKLTVLTSRIGGKELPRIDLAGAIARNEQGDAVYTHKKVKGRLVKDDPGYANWILGKDFPENTKQAIRAELRRLDPQKELL